MRKISNILRVEELEKLASLVVNDQDLQNRLNILKDSLIEYEKLEDLKNLYDVSFNWCDYELVIFDNRKNEEYRINSDFLDEAYLYTTSERIIWNIKDEIYLLEDCLNSETDEQRKELIRFDLNSLYKLDNDDIDFCFLDPFAWNNQKYISKNNIERFNELCEDLIISYKDYKDEKIA